MTAGALGLAEPLEVDSQGLFLQLSTREPELPSSLVQAQDTRAGRGLAEGGSPSKLFVAEEETGLQRERESLRPI